MKKKQINIYIKKNPKELNAFFYFICLRKNKKHFIQYLVSFIPT